MGAGMVGGAVAWLAPGSWAKKPASGSIIGMALALAYMAWGMGSVGWVFIVDEVSVVIHEAGHPLVGAFSERLMAYGGTIFQLGFPLAVAAHFARASDPLGFCFGVAWESTAVHAMGVYMADARALALPLVGNGDRLHDWAEIFGRWGLLAWDARIGACACFAAWMLWAACLAFLAGLWVANREREAGREAAKSPRRPF